jgi:hypothetical protein
VIVEPGAAMNHENPGTTIAASGVPDQEPGHPAIAVSIRDSLSLQIHEELPNKCAGSRPGRRSGIWNISG